MIVPIENADLTALNSFGFSSRAQYLFEIEDEMQLCEAVAFAQQRQLPLRVIGGGSNLILGDYLPGVTLHFCRGGYRVLSEDGLALLLEVEAGQNWHRLVADTVAEGWCGLENLALIPGSAGAAPVQNIGAYGVELKDRFHSLRAYDLEQGAFVDLDAAQCKFGYRDSLFKSGVPGRYIISRIRLKLSKVFEPVIHYGGLAELLKGCAVTAQSVFDTVVAVRRSKLPDPAALGNAGSFFENPVVPETQCEALRGRFPGLVSFPDRPGYCKLAAGWLIDQAGWKGYRQGSVGVYEKQALVLVHHGGGNAAELSALADAIRRSVLDKYGVALVAEPRVMP